MNWYFEEQGISRGPFTEDRMISKLKAGELTRDVLIWQPELKEWRSLAELNPHWLSGGKSPTAIDESRPPVVVQEQRAAEEPKKGKSRESPAIHVAKKPIAPGVESNRAIQPPPQSTQASTAQSKLKPKAPVENTVADTQKSGILKRVFGFGGKKK